MVVPSQTGILVRIQRAANAGSAGLGRQVNGAVIGQAKSPKKAAASKANGAKGGRPRKPQPAP